MPSKITGDLEPAYPNWKRIPAQILRIILIIAYYFIWIFLMSFLVVNVICIRAYHESPYWDLLNMLKDIIHGILMAAAGNAIFKGLTVALLNLENYKTEKTWQDQLTYTFFALDYWNFCVGLFMLAFVFMPVKQSGLYAKSLSRRTPQCILCETHGVQPDEKWGNATLAESHEYESQPRRASLGHDWARHCCPHFLNSFWNCIALLPAAQAARGGQGEHYEAEKTRHGCHIKDITKTIHLENNEAFHGWR